MKRWQVQFDGASVGAVYAETHEAARKEALAAYARVHPEREGSAEGRVKVDRAGADVASELGEARQLANEVYEGLRLLPGMELPAEKQRSIILLLEAVAARTDLETMLGQGKKGASGDNALQEAAASVLNQLEADEVKTAKVERGTLSRSLVRVEEKKDGWADAQSPAALDETAGNWMSKLERLRIVSFVENPGSALAPESSVVRVELGGKGSRKLGFLELYKVAGEGGKPKFLVKTEYTRWYAEVISSVAEQVEQDLGSVVKLQ